MRKSLDELLLQGAIWTVFGAVVFKSCVFSDVGTMSVRERHERHWQVYHRFGEDTAIRPWDELTMQVDYMRPFYDTDIRPFVEGPSVADYFSGLTRLFGCRFMIDETFREKPFDPLGGLPSTTHRMIFGSTLDHVSGIYLLHFDVLSRDHGGLVSVWSSSSD